LNLIFGVTYYWQYYFPAQAAGFNDAVALLLTARVRVASENIISFRELDGRHSIRSVRSGRVRGCR